jgi:hypothetical protein
MIPTDRQKHLLGILASAFWDLGFSNLTFWDLAVQRFGVIQILGLIHDFTIHFCFWSSPPYTL